MTKKEFIMFLVGAEAFFTLSQIILYFSTVMGYQLQDIIVNRQINFWGIVFNAIFTYFLYWWYKNPNG